MNNTDKKIRKAIQEMCSESAERSWPNFVRNYLGCPGCQHFDYKKKLCKNGRQAEYEEKNGIPCEGMSPTSLH